MNTRLYVRSILLATSLAAVSLAGAADLDEIYQQALKSDPQIREAEANRLAALEAKPQALSTLLPQLTGGAGYDDNESDGSSPFGPQGQPGDFQGQAVRTSWDLTLRQSVFRWENWVALQSADAQVAQAEADYHAAQQDLIIRASETYFIVLATHDTLEAAQAAHDAIARQLEQSEKRFEVGLIAVTDVQDAKAAFDSASATLILAKRNLATAQERLRELTGATFDELSRPGDDMPLEGPNPANAEDWVQLAMNQNARLISSRLAADIARKNISSERGGHFPSLDLVVSRSGYDVESDLTTVGITSPNDSNREDTTISLQLTVPFYTGGATSSRVRQAEYLHRAARERLEFTARQTERDTRDAYLGVNSEVARVQSLRQAVESAKTALQATEAGYEVGTRTSVDVLESRRRLFDAQTIYARSRYDYLLNVLRLRLAAGTLDAKGIADVNSLMTESVRVR